MHVSKYMNNLFSIILIWVIIFLHVILDIIVVQFTKENHFHLLFAPEAEEDSCGTGKKSFTRRIFRRLYCKR